MLTYLKNLKTERETLTQTANGIADTAAEETRDVTETEAATLASLNERCSVIDAQLATYVGQLEGQRAYAALQSRMQADADEQTAQQMERHAGNGSSRNGIARRDAAQLETPSWGEVFVRSGVLDSYTGHGQSQRVEVGSVLEQRAPVDTAASPYPPTLIPPPGLPQWANTLLGLVQTVRTASGSVAWIVSAPMPPADAPVVAEGALKPEMPLTLTVAEHTLATYAHYKAITRQALDDIPQIRSLIESYLRAGLQTAVEAAAVSVLAADANIPDITGPPNTGMLGAARVGLATVQTNGFTPNGLLLNPADWAELDLAMMAGTLNGAVSTTNPFGLTIAASRAVTAGTGYVGDFREGMTVFDRGVTNVFISDSHADFFLRNQLVLLGETRALPVVTTPTALVKVTPGAMNPFGAGGQQRATAGK